jgi:hypothetical protein
MAAIGLAQGLVLWTLSRLVEGGHWPAGNAPALLGLIYVSAALPLAWYLSADVAGVSARRRGIAVMIVALVLASLGACEGWVTADAKGLPNPGLSVPACFALAFVAIPLLLHVRTNGPNRRGFPGVAWDYAALFDTAWRNALVLAVAALLTGMFWGVLFAGAFLMRSIGVTAVLDVITHSFFVFVVTAVVFSAAIALALARADTIIALRRFCLSLNQAFLPLVLLFAVMWTVALPFTGIQPLLNTGKAGLSLLWFAALAVNFANAARQDGLAPPPFTPWLRRALTYAWLTLPVVVAVAAYAIYQRVAQYGWTAERVWSVFVLVMAAGYAVGYSLSALRPARGWMWSIDQTNVAMAILLCAGLIALTSPLADARRIAVASQIDRLLAGRTALEKIDFHYLHEQSGLYGTRALQALASGIPGHPEADRFARAARAQQRGKLWEEGGLMEDAPSPEDMRKRWRLLQADIAPAVVDALYAYLRADAPIRIEDGCLDGGATCSLWMGDLDDDRKPELLLVVDSGWRRHAFVYRWTSETATLTPAARIEGVTKEWIEGVAAGSFTRPQSEWRDIEAGGARLRILPNTP